MKFLAISSSWFYIKETHLWSGFCPLWAAMLEPFGKSHQVGSWWSRNRDLPRGQRVPLPMSQRMTRWGQRWLLRTPTPREDWPVLCSQSGFLIAHSWATGVGLGVCRQVTDSWHSEKKRECVLRVHVPTYTHIHLLCQFYPSKRCTGHDLERIKIHCVFLNSHWFSQNVFGQKFYL